MEWGWFPGARGQKRTRQRGRELSASPEQMWEIPETDQGQDLEDEGPGTGDRMGEEDRHVAAGDGHRLAERLLQRVAEDQAEQQRRLRDVELAEGIAQHAESQRQEQVEGVVVEGVDAGRGDS